VRFGLGYSLGEITALVASGVYRLEHVLTPLLALADDCAELARDVTMGIVFSRGSELDLDAVRRLCLKINQEGRGAIGISAHLSPNSVLLLGQANTVDRFKRQMKDWPDGHVHLRKHSGLWPPLHTPLLWQRNVPNRSALMMLTSDGGLQEPNPPVLSMVTGEASYNDYNSREILHRWLDHPQQLWSVVCELLSAGIDVVVHVGPAPNLIPATFKRLSDNVTAQLRRRTLNGLGRRAISGIANRPWLTKVLSTSMALLRAPLVTQVILEDWLLEQKVP
jgi:[acyl-carrier-protein] S-malonyltransferase